MTTVETETATALRPQVDLFAGRIVGERYRLDQLLGRGGIGEVWRAWDLKLRTEIALKAILAERASSERWIETLRTEVLAARRVISPNVCRVYDIVDAGGLELVSMEFVDGRSLHEILRTESPLDLGRARAIASQFLAGLTEIHAAGLIHRDLKPANLMVTRTDRVVIIDLGLALADDVAPGSVVGTPAYMAPEQARGTGIDARADLYAAGMILAEMVAPDGVRDGESQRSLWNAVRAQPPQLPETPWTPVILRVLRSDPDQRCSSAGELLRMIETASHRISGAVQVNPYPGLASFTASDAKYFFGRETEVEQMWRRLDLPHLQALIGPSGAGKSSFLAAGLIPAAPPGWQIIVATPGSRPFVNLARALAPAMQDDGRAVDELLRFDEPEIATALVARWRARREQALVIVDQFEELFTQNAPETQTAFAEMLARLPLQADTHVVLSMRDDFLFHCAAHPSLAPLFSEPFPLRPPSGPALRRAVVQPAHECGFAFEERLVDAILGEVEGERAALPLLAFAVAQLWERRDHERGLLTLQACEEIGGVAGAIARHAEATLDAIGVERTPIVREIFRNLVTAQGTRAARDRGELTSVFPEAERDAAADVLQALVKARLLTSYHLDAQEEADGADAQRFEIVHESLLSQWPRLVRWQTQDADGAQLRDQLRQAAQLWEQHGRADDFLWSGSAYREYQVWRENYPGGLTQLEEDFTGAMTTVENRRRTRRRAGAAAFVTLMLIVAAALAILWRRGVAETRRAEAEAKRATAANLLSLGRESLERDRTAALAYAIESLRLADTSETRKFVVKTLWSGPTARVAPAGPSKPWGLEFSPDGSRLAVGYWGGELRVYEDGGGAPVELDGFPGTTSHIRFSADGAVVLGAAAGSNELRRWSTDSWTRLDNLEVDRVAGVLAAPSRDEAIVVDILQSGSAPSIRLRRLSAGRDPLLLGQRPLMSKGETYKTAVLNATGARIALGRDRSIDVLEISAFAKPPTTLGVHPDVFLANDVPVFDPRDRFVAAGDEGGNVILWSLAEPGRKLRHMMAAGGNFGLTLSRDGSLLCVPYVRHAELWDLEGVTGADAVLLPSIGDAQISGCGIHPGSRFFATLREQRIAVWEQSRNRAFTLAGHNGIVRRVAFSPDSRYLYSQGASDGKVVRWPLHGGVGESDSVVDAQAKQWGFGIAIDPLHRFIAVTSLGGTRIVPLDGAPPKPIAGAPPSIPGAAVDPAGQWIATSRYSGGPQPDLTLTNLESGERRELGSEREGAVNGWLFDARGRLVISRGGKLQIYDRSSNQLQTLIASGVWGLGLSPDRKTAVTDVNGRATIIDLESGTVREPRWNLTVRRPKINETVLTPGCALGPRGIAAEALDDGTVRVGYLDRGEPHLLSGADLVMSLAISADGRWIAAAATSGVHLWPMPDLDKPPLHTLPHDQLIAKLESLTNVRAVADPKSPTGYRIAIDDEAYRGWKEPVEW